MARRATKPPAPFKYPTKASRARTEVRVSRPKFGVPEAEVLTQLVSGKKASALEERFARSLDKSPDWRGYEFRKKIIAPANMPGSIEIDFMAYNPSGEPRYIDIDGNWVHNQPETAKKDREDWAKINNYLRAKGLAPLIVIPGNKLDTQEMSDRTLRELV